MRGGEVVTTRWWRARDPDSAAGTLAMMLVIAGATLAVDCVLRFIALRQWDPWLPTGELLRVMHGIVVLPVSLAILAHLLRIRRHKASWLVGLPGPMLMLTVIAVLNIESHDASAGSQFFVLFPLIYAAHHLRPPAIWTFSGATIGTQVASSFAAHDPATALRNSIGVGMVVLAITILVALAQRRTENALAGMRRRATLDALTGLATRQRLEAVADRWLAGSLSSVGLILVDVDHFKSINDTHGHPAGDVVLREVARRLLHGTGSDDVVARMGGDELALLVQGCDPALIQRRAHELHSLLTSDPIDTAEGTVSVSVSIGVACGAATFAGLYSAADADLYRAKAQGRGRVAEQGGTRVPAQRRTEQAATP